MITNISSPLEKNTHENILEEIELETNKGMILNLIREYQINYANGSWSENILIPYKHKKKITNLIIVNQVEDAERLANKHVKKMDNLKPYVLDSIISTTDIKHWREQRQNFQPSFNVKEKLVNLIPISSKRAEDCVHTLRYLCRKSKKVDINEFLLNETHAQLQLAMFGFNENFEKTNNKRIRDMFYDKNTEDKTEIIKDLNTEIKNSDGPISQVINSRRELKNDRETIGNGLIFSYAGHDTTGNTLTFLIYELAKNQDYQEELFKEVELFWNQQKDKNIEYQDFKRLPFMTRCIMETLRLWPALANGTFRELIEDDYLIGKNGEKVEIPKGTFIQIPNWFRHRNPELWGEDVDKFNPHRNFEDEELWDDSVINTYNPSTPRFSPFTYIPRDCIGKNFSQIEMRLILLNLLKNFSFHLPRKNKYELSVYNKLTMGPRNISNKYMEDNTLGLNLIIKERKIKSKL